MGHYLTAFLGTTFGEATSFS